MRVSSSGRSHRAWAGGARSAHDARPDLGAGRAGLLGTGPAGVARRPYTAGARAALSSRHRCLPHGEWGWGGTSGRDHAQASVHAPEGERSVAARAVFSPGHRLAASEAGVARGPGAARTGLALSSRHRDHASRGCGRSSRGRRGCSSQGKGRAAWSLLSSVVRSVQHKPCSGRTCKKAPPRPGTKPGAGWGLEDHRGVIGFTMRWQNLPFKGFNFV